MLHVDNIVLKTHSLLLRPVELTVNYINPHNGLRSYLKSTSGTVRHAPLYDSEILHRSFSRIVQEWSVRCFM